MEANAIQIHSQQILCRAPRALLIIFKIEQYYQFGSPMIIENGGIIWFLCFFKKTSLHAQYLVFNLLHYRFNLLSERVHIQVHVYMYVCVCISKAIYPNERCVCVYI